MRLVARHWTIWKNEFQLEAKNPKQNCRITFKKNYVILSVAFSWKKSKSWVLLFSSKIVDYIHRDFTGVKKTFPNKICQLYLLKVFLRFIPPILHKWIQKHFHWSSGFYFIPILGFETVQFCTQKLSQPNHGGQSKNNPAIVPTQTDACSKNISANGKTDYMGWRVNVNGKSHGIIVGARGPQMEKNWGQIKYTQPEGIGACCCWWHLHHNVRIWFFPPKNY